MITWVFSSFQQLFCSPKGCQSYWLPQPRRRCIITVFKSSSGCFTYRSSPCHRFSFIWSVSDSSYSDRPLTTLIRLRRSLSTLLRANTPCHSLCNFSFHKGRSSASSRGILSRFTSVGCLHHWQFCCSKWCSTSFSILFQVWPSILHLFSSLITFTRCYRLKPSISTFHSKWNKFLWTYCYILNNSRLGERCKIHDKRAGNAILIE